ncbi:hypothetical protein MBLNU230_g6036t1 [Neophaeotheca triangularis]
MANQNGALQAQQNAAVYAMDGSAMPPAGHYADMQTLMQNMEQLSGWLAQNREDWGELQEELARVERAQSQKETIATTPADPSQPTASQLQTALSTAHVRITSLESTHQELLRLQGLYEDAFTDATQRIRSYCYAQQQHTTQLHQHYTQLLNDSRRETVEAQIVHQEWQARLQGLSQSLRLTMREREEDRLGDKGVIAGLREENRILRKIAGWEPAHEEDNDGDEYGSGTAAAEPELQEKVSAPLPHEAEPVVRQGRGNKMHLQHFNVGN